MLSQHQSWCEHSSSSSGWLLLLLRYIGGWGDLINYLVVFPSTFFTCSIPNLFVVLYWLECFFVCFASFLLIRYVHALASCSKTMWWYFGQLEPTSYQPLLCSFSLCWTKRLPEETNSREEMTFKCGEKKGNDFLYFYYKNRLLIPSHLQCHGNCNCTTDDMVRSRSGRQEYQQTPADWPERAYLSKISIKSWNDGDDLQTTDMGAKLADVMFLTDALWFLAGNHI